MTKRTILTGILALLLGLLLPSILSAQRGTITIPQGASISVPQGAVICADTIFANNPGYGTLTLVDPSGICSGCVVIPIEMLTFSVTLQDGVVHLSWTTATETRNYGFEVQRKTGKDDWSALGFVEGSGTATKAHAYTFTDLLRDVSPEISVLQYRLKQIDLDGQYEYSPEVKVRLDGPLPRSALEGFPSPCNDQLTVRLTLAEAGATSILLHDITGRVVLTVTQDAILPAGSYSMRVRTAELPSGLYLLVVENREGRRTKKVVIRH
jgi:hypothetical protein